MTTSRWTSFKLGLFTLGALGTLVLVAIALGLHGLHVETLTFHTYFDETVTGLEIGAPVRFRGVEVGTVQRVAIAPDGRMIDVALAVRVEEAPRLKWRPEQDTGLRAELQGQGLTGVKLVNLDFFDPSSHPPTVLLAPPPARYIPATQSVLGALEKSVGRAADAIPELVTAITAELHHLEMIFQTFDEQHLPARIGTALDGVTAAVAVLSGVLSRFDRAQVPEKTAATMAHLDLAAETIGRILARIDGDAGLVASTQRAAEAVGALGENTSGAAHELDRTLRDLGDAARAVRAVAESIERDPERLLKGPAKGRSR